MRPTIGMPGRENQLGPFPHLPNDGHVGVLRLMVEQRDVGPAHGGGSQSGRSDRVRERKS